MGIRPTLLSAHQMATLVGLLFTVDVYTKWSCSSSMDQLFA